MNKLKNSVKNKEKRTSIKKGSGNVFKDIGFSDIESVHLLMRADLMIEIIRIIDEKGWMPSQAAKILGIAQSRISELRSGKMDKFSVDLLLKYLAKLGKQVTFTLTDKVV